jgi:hypothetical protein
MTPQQRRPTTAQRSSMVGKLATSGRSHNLVERTKSHSLRASSATRRTDGITAVVAALAADRSGATIGDGAGAFTGKTESSNGGSNIKV